VALPRDIFKTLRAPLTSQNEIRHIVPSKI
jgi:hypothetical protein